MLLVPPKALLLVAAFVWLAAGVSVCFVGTTAFSGWTMELGLAFLGVYAFFLVIFFRISNRHIKRIKAYTVELISIFKFFDPQSYIILIVMFWFGLAVRMSGLVPAFIIAPFYSGLGFALLTCAIYYLVWYAVCRDELN